MNDVNGDGRYIRTCTFEMFATKVRVYRRLPWFGYVNDAAVKPHVEHP